MLFFKSCDKHRDCMYMICIGLGSAYHDSSKKHSIVVLIHELTSPISNSNDNLCHNYFERRKDNRIRVEDRERSFRRAFMDHERVPIEQMD